VRVKLLELAIHRLPGIERPFRLGADLLGEGVHVVHGPNGIGKSSILRALRALWWPQTIPSQGVSVAARFELAGKVWQAERDGTGVRWSRDGARCDAPELPDEHLSTCCLIGLDDLSSEGDAQWFSERVGRAFTGDYDLRGTRDRLFPQRPQQGLREARAWDEARAQRSELERAQRALLEEQRELEELDAALARATAAQAELVRLELARELAERRAQVQGLALRLSAFPAGLARLPEEAAETLEQLEARLIELRAACAQRERERAELAHARTRARLDAPLDPHEFTEARQRLDELRRLEGEIAAAAPRIAELEAREALDGAAAGGAGNADPERLRRGANALRAWLAAPEPERSGAARWLAHVAAAVAAVVLGLQVHPAWLALLVPVALEPVLRARRARPAAARPEWRAQFELAALAPPSRWDVAGVQLCLEELERQALDLERRARSERGDLAGARGRLSALETRRDEVSDALGAWFALRGGEAGADAPALARELAGLEQRSRELEQARERGRHLERELDERRRELEELERRRATVFERVGLRSDQRAELERMLESRAEWNKLVRSREALDLDLERLAAQLTAAGGAPDVAAEELQARIAAAREHGGRRDELLERRTAIRTRIETAEHGRVLEEARAGEAEAGHDFEQAWQAARGALVGRLLLEDVEREHAVSTRPALLETAGAHFARFTHGRYQLDVRDRDGSFELLALDSARSGSALGPGELSDGTRAQLLLAVRMAHVAHSEGAAVLPLFLDDALATSDAERTRRVAESLFELARRGGRQVFVLLRDASDARLIAGCGEGARVIDLAALRGEQQGLRDRERLAPPLRREVPAPDGLDPSAWAAQLGVPAPDPWLGVEDAHLYWLLVEERELLHEVLTWGVDGLGRLRALAGAGAASFLAADRLACIESQARLYEAVRRGWLVGRGLQLSRDVLERAEGVSATFLDRLDELSTELGRDAKRLLAAIEEGKDARTKGFRRKSLDALRDGLERSGHLDPRDVLDERAAWDRLLLDLPDAAGLDAPELRRRFEFLRARFDEALTR
jgi:exonuclease SbcC